MLARKRLTALHHPQYCVDHYPYMAVSPYVRMPVALSIRPSVCPSNLSLRLAVRLAMHIEVRHSLRHWPWLGYLSGQLRRPCLVSTVCGRWPQWPISYRKFLPDTVRFRVLCAAKIVERTIEILMIIAEGARLFRHDSSAIPFSYLQYNIYIFNVHL